MTGSEIKEFVEEIVDDSISDTLFLNFLNTEKDIVEESRDWEMLKKLNSSNSASQGNNYTAGIPLPTDFRAHYRLFVGRDIEYTPVRFDEQHLYRNLSHYYYVDVASEELYLLGNVGAPDTIYFYYLRTTPELTLESSPEWPDRYHRLLAYRIAARYMAGVEVDDIFDALSQEHRLAAIEMRDGMERWDAKLQNMSNNRRSRFEGEFQPTEENILSQL